MKHTSFLFFLFVIVHVNAQSESSVSKLKLGNVFMSNGYVFQKESLYEGGVKVDLITDINNYHIKPTFSMIMGGQVSRYNNVTYLNPFGMLRYFKPIRNKFSFVVSISYSYRKILGLVSNTITPEIGLNFNQMVTFGYGYNFFIDNQYDWVSKSRLALRLMLR